jgi:conjugal transfer ATP-binding protein TraC
MYHVTEKMCLGARKIQMALVIDEAWDMLKGGQGAKIIESIARRARKYAGCLVTITQSIADYFASMRVMRLIKIPIGKSFKCKIKRILIP